MDKQLDEQLQDLFLRLGKEYYEAVSKKGIQAPADYREIFNDIDNVKKEILAQENALLAKEGKKKCLNCGEIITIESRFCNMCGFPCKSEKKKTEIHNMVPKKRTCIKCGLALDDDADFCTNCGTRN